MILLVFFSSFGFVMGAQDTGYPAGLMADCPGMNRSTTLSEVTIRSLYVIAYWPTSNIFESNEKKCRLVGGAACIANVFDFKKRRTQVMVSGYMDASFSPIGQMFVKPYVKMGRNVLVLEIFPVLVRSYPISARLTKPLGHLLGVLLAELTYRGLSAKRLELIGGSLGAHIASYAATKYYELTQKKPIRLTGLDPAGPCFRNLPPEDRLNPKAAHNVDVLHTNIDGFGIADALGHIDFYANGGEYQQSIVDDFILPCFTLCSHVRAAIYWVSAISNPTMFLAVRCNSIGEARRGDCYERIETNVLGPNTNFSRPGIYYLPTTESDPYHFGEKGLKRQAYGMNSYLLRTAPDADMII